jgi:hypothetical protein
MALDPQLVAEALDAAVQRPETLDYFLDNLTSPEWITPLRERNLFAEAPEQRVDEEGLVRAPSWAQSRYLARVAASDPDAVLETASSIETNNERVVGDLADAALAMPVGAARKMTRLLVRFLDEQGHLYYLLPRKLVALIVRFAVEGSPEAGIPVMRALLKPAEAVTGDEYWRPRTKPRLTDWEYDMHLRKLVSEALPHAPKLFLSNLVGLLEESLKLLRSDPDDPDSDGSRAWRVRIGDDSGRGTDVEEALTSAVRDAAALVRERGLIDDHELVDLLTEFDGELYRRIAMYALRREPEADGAVARRFVLDTAELTHYEPSPEYRDLLRRMAPSLEQAEIETLLEVIAAGPDVDRYRELSETYGGRTPSDEDVAAHVAHWQLGRLDLLVDALPEDARERYEELRARYGPAELPLSWEVTTFTGPNSPVTVEELGAKRDDEFVLFLREWKPPERALGGEPSIEGLSRALSVLAEASPERVVRLAPQLRDVKPAYLQSMMHGLEQAIGQEKSFDWPLLLELLEWIVEQPRAIAGGRGDEYADLDPGWVWTRKAIAGLLERGVSASGASRVRLDERERIWRILERIASDPEPTPEEELRSGGEGTDPVTLALNTTRPRAIRAAIAYAVWVYQETRGTDEPTGPGFLSEHASEVAKLLDTHLNPEYEPRTTVRAVIAEFFGNLFALDAEWARENVDRIFPAGDTPLREAAWGAYVIYTRPYDNVFQLLRPVYLRSAELAAEPVQRFRWMNGPPVESFGEHVAAFVWRGVIGLDDPVLTTYWENVPAGARRHVVETVGRWAREVELPTELAERLQTSWAFVKENARPGDLQTELAGFAWWFLAPGLPVDWRLGEMQALLDQAVRPEVASLVTQELPRLAAERPLEALRVLRALLEREEAWFPDASRDEIERVLRIGYSSADAATRGFAYDTVNLLLGKGYRSFRVVLEEPGPTASA